MIVSLIQQAVLTVGAVWVLHQLATMLMPLLSRIQDKFASQLIHRGYSLGPWASMIPGPWYTRWTGFVSDFHFLRGTKCYYVHSLHRKYGPVVRIGPNEVDVSDIDAVKTIYGVKEIFHKSKFYSRLAQPGQQSLFSTVNVDFHRRHRRLLSGPLSKSSLVSFLPLIDAHVKLAVQKIEEEMKTRGSADVVKWWLFLATDVIGELTFGESFKMLEHGQKNRYIIDLENAGRMASLRSTFPSLLHLANTFPIPIFRYQRLIESDHPKQLPKTLFTKLFVAEADDKLPFKEVLDEAQSYIVAGSDTTANTLTYLTWAVCRRPDVKAALLQELRKLPKTFSEPDLQNLPYLNNVINESLRLYSAAPSTLPRVVPPGGVEIGKHWLKQGTTVSAQPFTVHRDHRIFPNPDEFIPSRWDLPTEDMKDAFMPFGRGPRVCIGLHLAKIELRLATARFFLAFPEARVSSIEGMSDADMKPRIYFLLSPAGGRCLISQT